MPHSYMVRPDKITLLIPTCSRGMGSLSVIDTEAFTNAMYRHTFGIITDRGTGAGGQNLGTGIGVFWKGTYLILTAAHTMEGFPYDDHAPVPLPVADSSVNACCRWSPSIRTDPQTGPGTGDAVGLIYSFDCSLCKRNLVIQAACRSPHSVNT
jgi:hypothetical protein